MNNRRPKRTGSEVRGQAPVANRHEPESGAARRRLPRSRRITSSREIRSLFQRGKRSRTAHLDVFDSPSPVSHPRVGVVVPKHRRTIVERNRLKRQLREVLRVEVLSRLVESDARTDLLVRARREAYLATYPQLRDELTGLVESKWPRASSSR